MVHLSDAASSSRVTPRVCAQGSAPAVHSKRGRRRVWWPQPPGSWAAGVGHGLCQEEGEKPCMPWNVHMSDFRAMEKHGLPAQVLESLLQLVLTVEQLRV